MKNLRAVIIDDEANAREALQNMLKLVAPEVEICGEVKNVDLGIQLINSQKPDLVFLDIQMPGKTGFDLLQSFEKLDFSVIFTTAYQEYALKAFRFSAIDYLLKPIDPDELIEAVNKSKNRVTSIDKQQVALLDETLLAYQNTSKSRQPNGTKRLALHSAEIIVI